MAPVGPMLPPLHPLGAQGASGVEGLVPQEIPGGAPGDIPALRTGFIF